MSPRDVQARRHPPDAENRFGGWGARILALGSLVVVAVIFGVIVLGSGKKSPPGAVTSAASTPSSTASHPTTTPAAGSSPIRAAPILTYHVINGRPVSSSAPASLYVPAAEFIAQMNALKTAGWRAITLDQLQAYWARTLKLGAAKPLVITFDGGYASQYANALPELKRLGWVGVLNLAVNGLPSSDGGLLDSQVQGLLAAGWELDLQGSAQPDLTALGSASAIAQQITTERQSLQSRFAGAHVNWFSYARGAYDPTVTDGVRTAGLTGATTLVPGWASPTTDRTRLPRLQVVAGTSPSALAAQISAAQQDPAPPTASAGG